MNVYLESSAVLALDAVHLATALEFQKIFSDLKVLSLDQRIQQNLESLGLESILPNQ